MLEYLLEPFLAQYYLLDAICGDLLTEQEQEKMFRELARVFCISREEGLEEYYRASRSEQFRAIDDITSYERLCRTIEFAHRVGQEVTLTARDRLMLAQKRKAMAVKAELFGKDRNITRESVVAELTAKAMGGNINAMTTLAYLEYHGIFLCPDRENAVRRARLCARWNDLFGNLLCIAYATGDRQEFYDTLFTVLRSGNQQLAFAHICRETGFEGPCQKKSVARIMEKAFGMEIVKRNMFDRGFAKVAFSRILSAEDKEKLLLNPQEGAISALSEIPFDAAAENVMTFRMEAVKELRLYREGEGRKILQNFAVAMNCPAAVYRPLLIVAGEEYLARMYEEMLRRGLGDTPLVSIDAGTLTALDFSGSKDNVLLRGLCETRCVNTVFLVKDCQELTPTLAEELAKMLDNRYRSKYKLFQPSVSLDLSGIRFVLIAEGKTAGVRTLMPWCETVVSEKVRPEEKRTVITAVFREQARAYGRPELTLGEGCGDYLAAFDTDQLAQILELTIRAAVFSGGQTIELEQLRNVCREENIRPGRREFGYTGGGQYA